MSKYTATQIQKWDVQRGPDWKPCRPENYKFESVLYRFRLAWAVFTRRCDALDWEERT